MADLSIAGTESFAGRVKRPVRQPLPQRVGGFGGVAGLSDYLRTARITHVIDATHPFATQMSANAVSACKATGVPLIAYTRPPWQPEPGDRWTRVADIPAAVSALAQPGRRVMLAVGRMNLPAFEANPQHFYLLRLVDPPTEPPTFPDCHVEIGRGPFDEAGDTALMRKHRIELVVSKNSGGTGGAAKLTAARALELPVIMIERPAIATRPEAYDLDEVIAWIGHVTDRGV
ncbi:MAG: cobalt-precorrin-6A reductase [Pseudomonadota bacterium]